MARFPFEVTTSRLCLRPVARDEVMSLKVAIDTSLEALQPWLAWAANEPTPLHSLSARNDEANARFERDEDWSYGIFRHDEQRVLGRIALHRWRDTSDFELGYWLRRDAVGKGYATEAAHALVELAFSDPDVARVVIVCDPRNVRSVAIARQLGFTHVETVSTQIALAGRTQDMIWHKRVAG